MVIFSCIATFSLSVTSPLGNFWHKAMEAEAKFIQSNLIKRYWFHFATCSYFCFSLGQQNNEREIIRLPISTSVRLDHRHDNQHGQAHLRRLSNNLRLDSIKETSFLILLLLERLIDLLKFNRIFFFCFKSKRERWTRHGVSSWISIQSHRVSVRRPL